MMEPLSNVLGSLAWFFLYASLKATVVVVLVLMAQKLFGRLLSANGRYLLWLPVVIGTVTPVGFDVEWPAVFFGTEIAAFSAEPAAAVDIATTTELRTVLPAGPVTTSEPLLAQPAATPFAWSSWLGWLWASGVVSILAMIALAGRRLNVLLRQALPAPPELQAMVDVCVHETACGTRITALQSSQIPVPMIAGLFNPVLLLPADIATRLSEQQLRHVFIHELMHLKRRDIAANWIGALLQALHWFNPVIWLAFARMRHDRELACDAATVAHLAPADRVAYGHTLLRLSETLPRARLLFTALGMLDDLAPLRQRIEMLVRSPRPRTLQTYTLTMLVLLLSALALSRPAAETAERAVVAAPAIAAPQAREVVPAAPAPVPRTVAPATPAPVAREVEVVHPVTPAPQHVAEPAMVPGAAPTPAPTPAPAPIPAPVLPPVAARIDATLDTPAPAADDPVIMAAVDRNEPTTPATMIDTSTIQQFVADIEAVKDEKVRYVAQWNETAAECEARKQKLFGSVSKACRQTVMALARGEVLNFAFECYQLSARHDELLSGIAATTGTQQPQLALADAARELAKFCSKETYANQYPSFATLFAEAESLKHYDPRVKGGDAPYLHHLDASRREYWDEGVTQSFQQGITDYGQNGNYGSFIALPATP